MDPCSDGSNCVSKEDSEALDEAVVSLLKNKDATFAEISLVLSSLQGNPKTLDQAIGLVLGV